MKNKHISLYFTDYNTSIIIVYVIEKKYWKLEGERD